MQPEVCGVVLSWSGGKDAAWALHRLRQSGVEVVALLTTLTRDDRRASMQGIGLDVLRAQARVCGLPLVEAWIDRGADKARYEAAVAGALGECHRRWPGVSTLAFGDLFLQDIRDYREAMCTRLGWQVATPLFGVDTAALAVQMMHGGLRAWVCCVDTTQLPASFAGRAFDPSLLADLPCGADPCGENGEFHTCVHAGPMFSTPLALARGDTSVRDGRFAFTDYRLA